MNGNRFDEQVTVLKRDLLSVVRPTLARFIERTGVTPKDIRMEMVETTTAGAAHRSYTLAGIRVEFEL